LIFSDDADEASLHADGGYGSGETVCDPGGDPDDDDDDDDDDSFIDDETEDEDGEAKSRPRPAFDDAGRQARRF